MSAAISTSYKYLVPIYEGTLANVTNFVVNPHTFEAAAISVLISALAVTLSLLPFSLEDVK